MPGEVQVSPRGISARGDWRAPRDREIDHCDSTGRRTATPYLRVDRIEQAIVAWSPLSHPLGPVGYAVAYELALEQLQLGLDAIVECVNPFAVTRDGWQDTAETAGTVLIEVEVIAQMKRSTSAAWRPAPPTWRV